jgi:hypothetical protein
LRHVGQRGVVGSVGLVCERIEIVVGRRYCDNLVIDVWAWSYNKFPCFANVELSQSG